jgi:hypothetical protein
MYKNNELCEKIRSVFPDIGECGIYLNVAFDDNKDVWVVYLKKGKHELKTYLESEDVNKCMDGKQCVGLGFQIAQLKENIKTV